MKLNQLVILALFFSTASFAQIAEDAVLLSFQEALEGSGDAYLETFQKYQSKHQQLLSSCLSRIKFYKTYSNFHYSKERDDLVLELQKDSILPLQQNCLPQEHDDITTTLLNIARSYHYLTEYSNKEFLDEAEAYYLQVGERQARSDSITTFHSNRYNDIAKFYNYIEDYKKAELYYKRALNIFSGQKSSRTYLHLLFGRADCLIVGKSYNEAINLLNEAIKFAQKKPDSFNLELSLCYDRLARCYKILQQFDLAESYIIKARQIDQSQVGGDLYNANAFASQHAQILKLLGKYDEAFSVYQEVKAFIKASGDEVSIEEISGINEDLAAVYFAKGDYKNTIELLHKSISDLVSSCPIDIFKNPRIKENRIFNLQYFQRQLGLKAKAMMEYGKEFPDEVVFKGALDAILKYDSLGQEILKHSWEEETHQIRIKELIPFYEIGIQAALELYSQNKNSAYLIDAHQVCSRFKSQLLHRGISIKERKEVILSDSLIRLESVMDKKISEYEAVYLTDLAADEETTESLKQYLDEKAKLDRFHRDNEVFKIIDNSVPNPSISIAEIRSKLDAQTAIIEYFVSADSIYAFLITHDKIQYQVCSADGLDNFFKYLLSGEGEHNSENVNSLIAILDDIDAESINNLIIIPDQQLLQLPFEALMLNSEYLIEQYNISYQYSTSFFTKERSKSSKKKYLGFASDYTNKADQLTSGFSKLPYAVDEINSAEKQFEGSVFINDRASKLNFETNCENAGLIHLALHSQLNDDYPDQSSLIFQSDSIYELLRASEIYNFDLNNELTILSACNTAVGQINPGDGVRSITRSFIHAGSASVLTTLWEAPDVSTFKIIKKFYDELKVGMTKDLALRNAKLEYINTVQPSYRHPKYWAHLVLVGNTDSLNQNSFKNYSFKFFLGLVFLLFIAILFFLKKNS